MTIMYKLLAKDVWGIGSSEQIKPGTKVQVKKKDGSVKEETVKEARGEKDGLYLYAIVAKPRPGAGRAYGMGGGGVRCPICGSREVMVNAQGRAYFCDECDCL